MLASHYFSRNGATMSDQPGGKVPPEIARPWDGMRWLREPVAWTLLALTAIIVLVSGCQLFNLAGARVPVPIPVPAVSRAQPVPVTPGAAPAPVRPGRAPVPAGASRAAVSAFSLRASAVAPQFINFAVQTLPVLAVVLVTFSGGRADRARLVVQTAVVLLAAAFALGLISLAGAAGSHTRPGAWFILEGTGLAITATALLFASAVMWPRPFRSLAPAVS